LKAEKKKKKNLWLVLQSLSNLGPDRFQKNPRIPHHWNIFSIFSELMMVQGCLFDFMRIPNQGSIYPTLTCQFFSLGAERERERELPHK
jgi:hypothetical protein